MPSVFPFHLVLVVVPDPATLAKVEELRAQLDQCLLAAFASQLSCMTSGRFEGDKVQQAHRLFTSFMRTSCQGGMCVEQDVVED